MCKMGDIILIEKFRNEYGEDVGRHPFIVLNTKNNKIESLPLDMVAVLLGSFKNDKHKDRMLGYDVNIEIRKENGVKKDSFVKGNQIYCFQRNKINYFKVGSVDIDVFIEINNEVVRLLEIGKASIITTNLSKEIENDYIQLEK